jgi:hypothetical protein
MSAGPILVRAEMPPPSQPPPKFMERAVESRPYQDICEGCGKHHGAVTAQIHCLRDALRDERAQSERLRDIVRQFKPVVPGEKTGDGT